MANLQSHYVPTSVLRYAHRNNSPRGGALIPDSPEKLHHNVEERADEDLTGTHPGFC